MKISKILLTTDFSEEAQRPYAAVADLARNSGATITLLHVVQDLVMVPHGAPLAPPLQMPGVEELVKSARQSLEDQAAQFEGVEVTTDVITESEIAKAIADYAAENEIDLLAVSTHGRSGFKRLVMGSVAEVLLRYAHVPVLVFPRQE